MNKPKKEKHKLSEYIEFENKPSELFKFYVLGFQTATIIALLIKLYK